MRNDIALHLQKEGLKAALVKRLPTKRCAGDGWAGYLDSIGTCNERPRRIATEAGLLGDPMPGIHPMLALVSDGAAQFDILEHGLCLAHTKRRIVRLTST